LLEREAARRAGLGFIGKSNMLIIPGIGSQVLLGVLLVNIRIEPDSSRDQRCGRCTTCLTACPTKAFVGPWLLDARRCIAYLTIEYKGWIALELRPLIGTRVFGCDVCQDVCPFNHGKVEFDLPGDAASENQARLIDLHRWLRMSSSDYRRLTSGTALRRASRWQLLRNAAIAAGNSGDPSLIEPLVRLLSNSKYPIVRGHSAWALGRYSSVAARQALEEAMATETESEVVTEITLAKEEQNNF
jgi:epoxyqueuosine reductase